MANLLYSEYGHFGEYSLIWQYSQYSKYLIHVEYWKDEGTSLIQQALRLAMEGKRFSFGAEPSRRNRATTWNRQTGPITPIAISYAAAMDRFAECRMRGSLPRGRRRSRSN